MIVWINGAFGAGKTTTAYAIHKRIPRSFVFDPENAGYYIRKNTPPNFSQMDFQDFPLWREINYKLLKMINEQFDGIILVPMTLVNPSYYNEIITALTNEEVLVKHFILKASKEALLKRLRLRNLGIPGRDSFAVQSIDRCLYAFEHLLDGVKIETDKRSVDSIADEISLQIDQTFVPDRRPWLLKKLSQIAVLMRHIR